MEAEAAALEVSDSMSDENEAGAASNSNDAKKTKKIGAFGIKLSKLEEKSKMMDAKSKKAYVLKLSKN